MRRDAAARFLARVTPSASGFSARACRGSTSACIASAPCRCRSRRSPRFSSARFSRCFRPRQDGSRRASRRRRRRARLSPDPRRVDALRMAAQLDLHRLSVAVGGLRSRSAGRCRAMRRFWASSAFHLLPSRSPAWHGCFSVGSDQRSSQQLCSRSSPPARGAAPRPVDRARGRAGERGSAAGKHRAGPEVPPRALRGDPRHLRAPCGEHRREADRVARNRHSALPRPHRAGLSRRASKARPSRNGGDLLLGVPYRDRAESGYFNSVISLGASPPQAYHKSHLVPFGEFIPPGFGWVAERAADPAVGFLARRAPISRRSRAAGQRVAVNVCYEDAFGDEIARRCREATLLVNVSNVAWFGDSLAPAQHLQIARLRAVETGRMHARRDQHRHHRGDRPRRPRARAPCRSSPKACSK